MTTYLVRRWYNNGGYDEFGMLPHVDETFDDYDRAKQAYASALECYGEDAYEIELVRRRDGYYDFTMASSKREHPRRIIIDEEWLPDPDEKADEEPEIDVTGCVDPMFAYATGQGPCPLGEDE